ncbi:DUF7010 family protein [Terribacillus aidingensis]|uniref:DUF7010 family protein n=1 Tax=Terribacillus aidingensis TaxID=586416 RepID=UPI003CCB8F69
MSAYHLVNHHNTVYSVLRIEPEKHLYVICNRLFPLSVGISTLLKADWKSKDNPLGDLGLYLNLAQLIYFPIPSWEL